MEFDKSRVYTAVNADELKVGSKVIVADDLGDLKDAVLNNEKPETLLKVFDEYSQYRFQVGYGGNAVFALVYLVEEPAKLKWTDLKVGDIIRRDTMTAMVTAIDSELGYRMGKGGARMILFALIVSFMFGWLAHKAADMYDRKREEVEHEKH